MTISAEIYDRLRRANQLLREISLTAPHPFTLDARGLKPASITTGSGGQLVFRRGGCGMQLRLLDRHGQPDPDPVLEARDLLSALVGYVQHGTPLPAPLLSAEWLEDRGWKPAPLRYAARLSGIPHETMETA